MATLNRTQAIPLANYPSGSANLPVITVPDTATRFYLELQRCTSADPTIWPDAATAVSIDLEISYDNGVSWQDFAAWQDDGGLRVRSGQEVAKSALEAVLDRPGSGRKLRGTVTVSNGPLRTQGFYEARA